ncbi:Hypothetical protein NGAL_HAMBI2427_62130 [Neorhizobium galegae bv. orientalis]|nr:Hypothetical protein NGAL_HAMBI2427_62130 [Neorhizobium galegae bv. orientalis]
MREMREMKAVYMSAAKPPLRPLRRKRNQVRDGGPQEEDGSAGFSYADSLGTRRCQQVYKQ